MRSLAILEARRRGVEIFPTFAVDWLARGFDLGRGVYSPAMRNTALGPVAAVTQPGGWSEITYGSGIEKGELSVVEATVGVSDPNNTLLNMLETYDPRGSAARIDWAAAGLAAEDWEPCFRGVVNDWARQDPFTKILLKTDDTVLRTPVPAGVFAQTEWGSAYDGTIFGTHVPLVLGIHNSFQITARGAVPLVNIRYDKDLGYWWALSSDRMVQVTRLYYDGVLQGELGWSVLQGVFGANQFTIIVIQEGYQPAKEVIVSVDCKGPNEDGLSTGSTLTGAPDQLRVLLEEFAYRRPPLAGWRGPFPIIGSGWDEASAYYALHRFESARRLGADQTVDSAAELIQSFLDAYPWARIWWTPLGQLDFMVIDPDDVDPDDALHFELDKHSRDGTVPFAPGDRREVYTHVRVPYLWSAAEQKFMSAYEAHDVAALPEKVPLAVENPWSQARLVQEGDLNPAAPDDPVIPT